MIKQLEDFKVDEKGFVTCLTETWRDRHGEHPLGLGYAPGFGKDYNPYCTGGARSDWNSGWEGKSPTDFTDIGRWRRGYFLRVFHTLYMRDLWSKLGDVPVDDDEILLEGFMHFEAGTHRETVWKWFEYWNFPVAKAMGLEKGNE